MIRRLIKAGGILAASVLGAAFALGGLAASTLRRVTARPLPSSRPAPSGDAAPGASVLGAGFKSGAIFGAALLVAGGALAAGLAIVAGLIPISASSGHWAITEWFLQFTMRRSVATHSLGIQAPPLDDPDLVLKGARHYEIGCRSCHGAPGTSMPRIPAQMTPHPPDLPPRIRELTPPELFYIVKHGVKFTGMPAWPSRERDDEVWAVVAFLQKLPELDEAGYRRLAGAAPATAPAAETASLAPIAPKAVAQSCARCHGADGTAPGSGAFPNLAGQRRAYLENALTAYAHGQRHSGIMEPVAAGLEPAAIRGLARYYASLEPAAAPPPPKTDASALRRGELIAHHGIPDQGIPSCVDCHEPPTPPYQSTYPRLAGQHADYLVRQLELFQQGRRGGSPYAHIMRPIASRLRPDQIRDVALYLESLRSSSPPRHPPQPAPMPQSN